MAQNAEDKASRKYPLRLHPGNRTGRPRICLESEETSRKKLQTAVTCGGERMRYKTNIAFQYSHKQVRTKFKNWKYYTGEAKFILTMLFISCSGECPICSKSMWISFDSKMDGDKASLDHVVPISEKSEQDPYVLRLICSECNNKKIQKP